MGTKSVILDGGHGFYKVRGAGKEIKFPHALRIITEREFETVRARSRGAKDGLSDDYLIINGKFVVVGESAERHGFVTRKTGAARYDPNYYGLLAAASCAKLFKQSAFVELFCGHPPGDISFRDQLLDSVYGTWQVVVDGREREFEVTYANTYEEPWGGYMNMVLADNGQEYKRADIKNGRTLMFDIGNGTSDMYDVERGGKVGNAVAVSIRLGTGKIEQDVEKSLREHPDLKNIMRGSDQIPPERIREAIRTGIFRGAGMEIPCHDIVNEATSVLLNRLSNAYQDEAGGPLAWDTIGLTGAGTEPLYDRLLPILDHKNIEMAEKPGQLMYANVRGADKLWKALYANGINNGAAEDEQ